MTSSKIKLIVTFSKLIESYSYCKDAYFVKKHVILITVLSRPFFKFLINLFVNIRYFTS